MGPTLFDHFMDFWVIFFADVAAAYVALTWFESKKEDRNHAKTSLNHLLLLVETFTKKYRRLLDNFQTSSDSSGTGLPREISDEDREFAKIGNDGIFWGFKGSDKVRPIYNSLRTMKDGLTASTVGEAKQKLNSLLSELDRLKNECERQMSSKKLWSCRNR